MAAGRIVTGAGVQRDLILRPDVCVVGSGPGGAIVASRLASAGAGVVVLEEGGHHTKAEFDMQESTAYPRLYQDRGNRATADLSIAVLQGRAVGGGTVVNWTTSFRIPDDVLAVWREKEGSALTPQSLRPHFDEVEKRLGITKVDLDDVNPNNRALYDGCKKMGWSVDTIKRNVRECLRTGYCGMGCPIDAKQSATLTYLRDAVARGATVYANCRVRRFEWDGTRAQAVIGEILHPMTQKQTGRIIRVEPRELVLSCGALNTPALLFRSGLPQGPVGKKTWLHPAVAMIAIYRDEIEGYYGATQSVASHQFARRDPHAGFFMEAAPVHPMLAGLAFPGFGAQLTGEMGLLPNAAVSVALMIDGFGEGEEGGTVSLRPDGAPKIDYPLGQRHAECFRTAMKALAQAHLSNGALRVSSMHVPSVSVRSEKDLRALDSAPFGPNRCAVFTAHQMGGCRMGADPARSVVRPD